MATIEISNFGSRWALQVRTHPDFAKGVETPLGWERFDNDRSGIRERWSTTYTVALPSSPLVLTPEPGGWVHSLVKEQKTRLDDFSEKASLALSENGELKGGHNATFTPQVVLSPEVREKLTSLCAAINAKQGEVEEAEVVKLFGSFTAREFHTTDRPEHICKMLTRTGFRPWTKRYLGGRHLVAFAGPDKLVKAPKALMPHLIGRGGVMAREVCRVTGASRIVEG